MKFNDRVEAILSLAQEKDLGLDGAEFDEETTSRLAESGPPHSSVLVELLSRAGYLKSTARGYTTTEKTPVSNTKMDLLDIACTRLVPGYVFSASLFSLGVRSQFDLMEVCEAMDGGLKVDCSEPGAMICLALQNIGRRAHSLLVSNDPHENDMKVEISRSIQSQRERLRSVDLRVDEMQEQGKEVALAFINYVAKPLEIDVTRDGLTSQRFK